MTSRKLTRATDQLAPSLSVSMALQMNGSQQLQANTFQSLFDGVFCMFFMFAIHRWVEPFSLKYLNFELTPNRKMPIGMFFMALSMVACKSLYLYFSLSLSLSLTHIHTNTTTTTKHTHLMPSLVSSRLVSSRLVYIYLPASKDGLIEMWRKQTPIVQGVDVSAGISEPISELSMYWQVIPSLLMAIGESFEWVGAQEWFYDEAPDCYKATMSSLFMLSLTFAGLLSNVFLSALSSWVPNNLNNGQADLFMFVFAGVVLVGMALSLFNVWAYQRTGGSYQRLVIQEGGSLFGDGSVDNSKRVNAHHHNGMSESNKAGGRDDDGATSKAGRGEGSFAVSVAAMERS